jgi:hypothetical protein
MRAVAAVAVVLLAARADATCRSVEITFRPTGALQIAVWIESADGRYIDTAFVSRSTGSLGLANRPGSARLKTDFRFPYGRRDMVLPVWAHARDHRYGLVVMGGAVGTRCGPDCSDETIGGHALVSSSEPFYCSPRGSTTNSVDVISCSSAFFSSKGAYADPPAFSRYPPRADLTMFSDTDSLDARGFSTVNDLVAVSAATPPPTTRIDPPIRWIAPSDGSYVVKVELSAESDFNDFHHHPQDDDPHPELNAFGHDFLGQPSIVYAVPVEVGPTVDVELASRYAGYGDWDGATGALHPPDATISDEPGSGAGRLLDDNDAAGPFRVLVRAGPCAALSVGGACDPPDPPGELTLSASPTSIAASWSSSMGGPPARRFDLRYRDAAIRDGDFLTATPSSTPPPAPGPPGATLSSTIDGLRPAADYWIAVRAVSECGAASPIATRAISTTAMQFTTLHGCFVATAAWGSPMARDVELLRRFRDRALVARPLGRLAVALYYAFSPPLARAISVDERLRAAARRALAPAVALARAWLFLHDAAP